MSSDNSAPAPDDLDRPLGASVEVAEGALALTGEGDVSSPSVDPRTERDAISIGLEAPGGGSCSWCPAPTGCWTSRSACQANAASSSEPWGRQAG